MEKFISMDEASKKLGKSPDEIRVMVKDGKLRAIMTGGAMKFRETEIAALSTTAKEDTLMTIDADVLFGEGEGNQPADAAAETWIAADMENIFESEDFKVEGGDKKGRKELQPAPLTLSKEKDDTALGTVLMDNEGGSAADADEPVIAIDPESGIATITSPTPGISRTHMIVVSEPEPRHQAFTPLLVVSFGILAFAFTVIISFLMGNEKPYKTVEENLPAFLGGAIIVAIIAAVVGYVLDRQKAQSELAAARLGRR